MSVSSFHCEFYEKKMKCLQTRANEQKKKNERKTITLLIVNRNETYSHIRTHTRMHTQTFHSYRWKQCLGWIYTIAHVELAVGQYFFLSSISHRLKQYLICICEMNMCGHTLNFTVCALDEVEMALFCIFPSVNWIKRTRERSEKTKRIAQTTKPIHCFYIINLRKKWKSNKQTQNLGLLLHFIEWQPIQSLKYINPINEHNL